MEQTPFSAAQTLDWVLFTCVKMLEIQALGTGASRNEPGEGRSPNAVCPAGDLRFYSGSKAPPVKESGQASVRVRRGSGKRALVDSWQLWEEQF